MASQAKARREDKNKSIAQQIQEFSNDSVVFFNKCAKPDKNGKSSSLLSLHCSCMKSFHLIYIGHLPLLWIEYMKILQACAMGFIVIGFIGYIIKLVFIPINNIILGAWVTSSVWDVRTSEKGMHGNSLGCTLMLRYRNRRFHIVSYLYRQTALKDIYLSQIIKHAFLNFFIVRQC